MCRCQFFKQVNQVKTHEYLSKLIERVPNISNGYSPCYDIFNFRHFFLVLMNIDGKLILYSRL